MPAAWFSFKKSLRCKSEPSEVHDPKSLRNLSSIRTVKLSRCGCSRSISNLRDVVIHGSNRHSEKPTYSPRSIGSSEFLNPIAHEVIIDDSTCELKITGFLGTLKTGTPGPGAHHSGSLSSSKRYSIGSRTPSSREIQGICSKPTRSFEINSNASNSILVCHKCGEQFRKIDAAEAHHLANHAVTELVEGDSSRRIVELICRPSVSKTENPIEGIGKVLKVHNMQNTIAQFEEYRDIVKIKASKLPKKHPRCLADGNELLRFHATNVACHLGLNGCCSLCTLDNCGVCSILRHGFSNKKANIGVFTTSTCERALENIKFEENQFGMKALIVCRVIAGRVHRHLENLQQFTGQSGFDSLAGKVGQYSSIEELYLLNVKALLPCFVVIWKP